MISNRRDNNYNLYIFSLTRMIKQQNQYDFSIHQNYIKKNFIGN